MYQDYLKRKVIRAKKKFLFLLDFRNINQKKIIPYSSAPLDVQMFLKGQIKEPREVIRSSSEILIYDPVYRKLYWENALLYQVKGKEDMDFSKVGAYIFTNGTDKFCSGRSGRSYLSFITEVQQKIDYRKKILLLNFPSDHDYAVAYHTKENQLCKVTKDQMKYFFLDEYCDFLDPFAYCTDKDIIKKIETLKKDYVWKRIFLDDSPKNIIVNRYNNQNQVDVLCEMLLLSAFSINDKELKKIIADHIQIIGEYVLSLLRQSEKNGRISINSSNLHISEMTLSAGRSLLIHYVGGMDNPVLKDSSLSN